MWNKISQIIDGEECEFRERLFRIIILASGIASVAGILEGIFLQDLSKTYILMLLLLLVTISIAFVTTFRYKKYDVAAMALGLVLMVIFFPVTFFLNGGVQSGVPIWFVLVTVYIFIMFTGKKFWFFLGLSLIVHSGTYLTAYYRPELLQSIGEKKESYFDSFFSVITVGCIVGVILKAYMKDFEEEHQLNLQQKEELEQKSDSKNVLFANLSHEIRTPINAIIGFNEMILRSALSTEVMEYAKDIQTASKLLLNQVNDILDLSQMEMGRMKIIPVQYETKKMLRDVVNMVRLQIAKKGLDFELDIDKNIPSVLLGDEKRIRQVLLNILDNAVKYTEKGSVTFSVQGELCEPGTMLLGIKVIDTGVGIRKEDLEYIYESFHRFDEKKNSKVLGSGLGLAITKQLVDLMGGEIKVDSIYRKGSIFSISIKQKIVDMEPIGMLDLIKGNMEEEVYRPTFEAPEARILIVDDNRMNSMVASKLLSSTKVQVDIADSGAACLNMTKKKYYHVILLDYMMPDMNGEQTLHEIRIQENGLCREAAIIALTGNTFSGAEQIYADQGFDGYVEKPIQSRILETEVLKFLPEDIIEYLDKEDIDFERLSKVQKTTMKKKKKICITTDCVCDTPVELLKKYGVKIMYLYVKTSRGRFADTREIDSSSLTQYMTEDGVGVQGDYVSVEEFEEFFSNVMSEAEQVIHITLASGAGRAHNTSVKAAKGFDHVRVIDSGQVSSGQGLIVLHAAKLAMEGKSVEEICAEVERIKSRIKTRFIIPRVESFHANGYMRKMVVKACQLLDLHPYAMMRQSRTVVTGLLGGTVEHARRQGIRWHLRNKRKICKDVVFITHAGCSVKEQEFIKKEVLKCIPFERVIIQKASLSTSCVSGAGAVGISYYTL